MSFTPFTRQEIESALPPDFLIVEQKKGQEIVYGWTIPNQFSILCYSGIEEGTEVSRAVGEDAIRFCIVDGVSSCGYDKAVRVHRTGTVASLRERMQERFNDLLKIAAANEPRCAVCGAATVERANRRTGNPFRGCIRWRECKDIAEQKRRETRDVQKEAEQNIEKLLLENPDVEEHENIAHAASRGSLSKRAVPKKVIVPSKKYRESELVSTSLFPHLNYGWKHFNPIQSAIVPLLGKNVNIIVAAKTSAGKTVIAELMIDKALSMGKRGIFLSPLKAVTEEKHREWISQRFPDRRISILTGDFILTDKRRAELERAEVVLMTSEMLDSRTRHMKREKNEWLYDVGVLVCDEAHLLTMPDRGDRLESGLIRFSAQNPKARIVLLSATMPNVEDLASWLQYSLNGKLTQIVQSDWRPVECDVEYIPHATGRYSEMEKSKDDIALELILSHPKDKFLVFVHSKASGRRLLGQLQTRGVASEFHSADLSRDDRLRIEADFMRK